VENKKAKTRKNDEERMKNNNDCTQNTAVL
jgi:hypothetical protein